MTHSHSSRQLLTRNTGTQEHRNDEERRCKLAPDFTISRVLTGLWQVADMERSGKALDVAAAAASMRPYADAGFTTFDMADHYGSAEVIAGEFKRLYPNQPVQLLTKWVPKPGYLTREDVREAVQRSLDRMQTDVLDMLQFHAWQYAHPAWLDELFWLQELKEEGLIRHLGLTNFDTAHLRVAVQSGIEIATNQVCFSVLDRRPLNGMVQLCEEFGVRLLAYGTVAGGFLSEKWLGKAEPGWENSGTWSQMKYARFIQSAGGWDVYQDLLSVLAGIANRRGVSIANVACRYVLDQPAVGGIIVGARLGKSEHIVDNARLFSFTLDEKDHTEIEEAASRLQPIPGDCGDEYRRPPFLTASGDLSHHLDSMPLPYETQQRGGRTHALSGTEWECIAGFSRAVRHGERIVVSGTTATHRDRLIGGSDPIAQAHAVIDKIEGALISLGGSLDDVIRTRVYVQDINDWEEVARVHGERFGEVRPANTLVQADLVGEGYLVEMEVDCKISSTA